MATSNFLLLLLFQAQKRTRSRFENRKLGRREKRFILRRRIYGSTCVIGSSRPVERQTADSTCMFISSSKAHINFIILRSFDGDVLSHVLCQIYFCPKKPLLPGQRLHCHQCRHQPIECIFSVSDGESQSARADLRTSQATPKPSQGSHACRYTDGQYHFILGVFLTRFIVPNWQVTVSLSNNNDQRQQVP